MDLRSTNGTRVNGDAVHNVYLLQDADTISFGDIQVAFHSAAYGTAVMPHPSGDGLSTPG